MAVYCPQYEVYFSARHLVHHSSQSGIIPHTQTHAPTFQLLGLLVLPQRLTAWLSWILYLGSCSYFCLECLFQRGKFLAFLSILVHLVLRLPAQWKLPWLFIIIVIIILKIMTVIKLSEYLPYASHSAKHFTFIISFNLFNAWDRANVSLIIQMEKLELKNCSLELTISLYSGRTLDIPWL